MSDVHATDRGASGAGEEPRGVPPTQRPWFFPDRGTVPILGGFVLLAGIVVLVMWPYYQDSRHDMQGDYYFNNRQYEKAIPHLEFIARFFPQFTSRREQLAWSYFETNQPAKALACYEGLLKDNPTDAYNDVVGLCYLELGQLDQAQPCFSKALAKSAVNSRANYGMGRVLLAQGKPLEAARYFQNAANRPDWDQDYTKRTEFDVRSDPYRGQAAELVLRKDSATTATAVGSGRR